MAALLANAGLAQSEQIVRFDGGGDDRAFVLATDAAGSLYTGGSVESAVRPTTFAVVKQNAQGAVQWVGHYQGTPGQIAGTASAVVLDAAGNVYASGYVARQVNPMLWNIDWLVVSFDPNGVQRWAHVYDGPGSGFDQAGYLAIDPSGALYASGMSGVGNDANWLTVKYSLSGAIQWMRVKSGSASADDRPSASVVDSAGNLVVLGYLSNVGVGLAKDVGVVKYDAQGGVAWERTFTETASSDEFPGGLAVDATGNVYVTGITVPTTNPELPNVPFTLKYGSGGVLQFFIKSDTAGGSSIALAPDGNLVVAGTTIGEGGSFVRPALSKIDPLGALIWSVPAITDGDVFVRPDGSILFGGNAFTSGNPDYYAAKYTSSGQKLWDRTVSGTEFVQATHLAANGDFYITGNNNSGNIDIITARFAEGFVPPPLPAIPVAPSALSLAAAKGKLTLQWSDNSSDESGFRIERSINGGSFAQVSQVGANVKTFVDTGLNKKNTYTYRVRAFNGAGNSAFTNTATGKPQ